MGMPLFGEVRRDVWGAVPRRCRYSYGLRSHGLYSYDLYRCGMYSYGPRQDRWPAGTRLRALPNVARMLGMVGGPNFERHSISAVMAYYSYGVYSYGPYSYGSWPTVLTNDTSRIAMLAGA